MNKLVIWGAISAVVFSSAVFSHTKLTGSVPADNSILQTAPQRLALEFRSEVRLVKLSLHDSDTQDIKFNFKPTASAMKEFSYALPTLATGNYRVNWMIMGSDTHKETGYYTFMVHEMDPILTTNMTTDESQPQ